jgi:hypothetical protein
MSLRLPFYTLILSGLFFLILGDTAYCQLIPLPLQQRIDKASIVFEGKVTSKISLWDAAHQQIYTSNTVTVYKVFKGKLTAAEVTITTLGGTVGHDREEVTHSLQLEVGDVGVFTAIPDNIKFSQPSTLIALRAYAGLQGFIKYNLGNHTATDPFTNYKSIANEVYPAITGQTKLSINTIKKADFNIQ